MNLFKRVNSAKRKGFTMIELMLVIVIGVGLSAFVIPRFTDTKKMNEAREESQKLSELKAKIESMFDMSSNFSGLEDMLQSIAPSTYERSGSDKLKSIWRQDVSTTGGDGNYTITYSKVPADAVCAEFVKNSKRQMWNKIAVGSKELDFESKPNEMVEACKSADGSATATKDIVFTYEP